MGKIGLIIAREYLSRVKKKSFILMTILGPILIVGFLTLAIYININDETAKKVLVCDESGITKNLFKDSKLIDYTTSQKRYSNEEFIQSEYDFLIQIHEKPLEIKHLELVFKKTPSSKVESQIRSHVNEIYEKLLIQELNIISMDDYKRLKAGIELNLIDINSEKGDNRDKAYVGFFFAILIYMFIFLYGAQVMRGVIEEKTSRVVEVLVSSVKPFELMMGKIIGIMFVGLTQFILWIILIFIFMLFAQNYIFSDIYDPAQLAETTQLASGVKADFASMSNNSDLYTLLFHRINYGLLISCFIFYFIGGYLLYGALFAAIGAAVDSEADTQQFMLPITIPLIFSFIIAQMGVQNPEGNALNVASVVPFTSPVSMMVKVAMGGSLWQLFLSMAILIVAFIFVTWIAAKIYRTGILMYGKKASYKELWKWMWYKG